MTTDSIANRRGARRAQALLGTAALIGALLAAPQANAASTGNTPGLAACISQITTSGHGDLLDGSYTIDVGTPGNDGTNYGPEWHYGEIPPGHIFCGLAGNDGSGDVYGAFFGGPGNDSAEETGIFVGGPGDDHATLTGQFEGGPGNDSVIGVNWSFDGGTGNDSAEYVAGGAIFYGGPGNDTVVETRAAFPPYEAGLFHGGTGNDFTEFNNGTYYGGSGNDSATINGGTFYGGLGDDNVQENQGRFDGGAGNDTVKVNYGTFIGGPGYDVVLENHGTCKGVEVGC